MGYVGFLNFGLNCIQLLAWPSLALGYPLCASIKAIEANSKSRMRKLITYWILFSLMSLFEHALGKLIDWLPFWPYVKILAVCLLVIPQFDGAYEAYKSLVRPCLSLQLLEVAINFWKGEAFLVVAERYVNENGTEALEQLIAKKGALHNFGVEEIKSNEVGEKKQEATLIQPKSKEPIVTPKDVKAEEVLEESTTAPENSVKSVDTLISQTEHKTNIAVQVNNMILPETSGENAVPESSALECIQKEWTCAACQITTSSETSLNFHLKGRKHKAKCEKLNLRKEPSVPQNDIDTVELKKSVAATNKIVKNVYTNLSADYVPLLSQKEWTCNVCQVKSTNEASHNSHLQGKKHRSKCGTLESTRHASNQEPKNAASLGQNKTGKAEKRPKINVIHGHEQWNPIKLVNTESTCPYNMHNVAWPAEIDLAAEYLFGSRQLPMPTEYDGNQRMPNYGGMVPQAFNYVPNYGADPMVSSRFF